ncbi:MAG: helix-turn-helix domain-containing protein [Candidatus Doudnabacteria bacterium]
MVADISSPSFETRVAILQTKLAKKGVSISQEVIDFIAENIVSNIRDLEGALNKIIVFQQLENKSLTLEKAKELLGNMVTNKKRTVSIQKIAEDVAVFYSITVQDLINKSRKKEYVKPRQAAMYLIRKELDCSYPTIGDFFGGRDHTTVMHGVEKITKAISAEDPIKQELEMILEKVYN